MAAINTLADVETRWTSHELMQEIQRNLGRGLTAAAVFLSSRVKELISVPAPRGKYKSRRTGLSQRRATVPATPGAPPRKLSGTLRRSINYAVKALVGGEAEARVGVFGTNVNYGRFLELGGTRKMSGGKATSSALRKTITIKPHPYLRPSLVRWQGQLTQIIKRTAG